MLRPYRCSIDGFGINFSSAQGNVSSNNAFVIQQLLINRRYIKMRSPTIHPVPYRNLVVQPA
ncbi:MAG: hypothetical protein HC833_07235 [Leptolyngbyaceae cyanobacterium RM1_406_9]|nr:hypothetical protein [Leptolyngbyaceae cyanobacterium RM1_406_9]